jgi:N-acetylglutamate synthase-like GNAT family acetyltransferase
MGLPIKETIRPAVEEDQQVIVSLVRRARLYPSNLHWSRFMVAEVQGRIAGLRQVKIHKNGTREIASGYVRPEFRRQGISARLMNEILAKETRPLYLMCNSKWVHYYEQFGFYRVPSNELPRDFGRKFQIWKLMTFPIFFLTAPKTGLIPMKRNASEYKARTTSGCESF